MLLIVIPISLLLLLTRISKVGFSTTMGGGLLLLFFKQNWSLDSLHMCSCATKYLHRAFESLYISNGPDESMYVSNG